MKLLQKKEIIMEKSKYGYDLYEVTEDNKKFIDGFSGEEYTLRKLEHLKKEAEIYNKNIEIKNKEILIENEKFKNAKKGFIRFGKLPADGRSWNARDEFYENGVSVYPAEFLPSGEWRADVDGALGFSYMAIAGSDVLYRVWGEVVGVGSDTEPLLNVTKFQKIKS